MGQLILSFTKVEVADKIRHMLEISGYRVYKVCHTAAESIRIANELDGAVIITGFKLTDGTVNDMFRSLPRSVGVIALLKPEQQCLIDEEEIFILPLPTNGQRLAGAVDLLFGGWQRKSRRKPPKRDEKETELVNKAKQLLMECNSLSEEQAHKYIQKKSMDTGMKLADTAKLILGME